MGAPEILGEAVKPPQAGPVIKEVDISRLNTIQQNPQLARANEAVKKFGIAIHDQYRMACETLFKSDNREAREQAARTISNILGLAGYKAYEINTVMGLQQVAGSATRELLLKGETDRANELIQRVSSGKYNSAEQILGQMQNWGYTEFVEKEREALKRNEAIIAVVMTAIAAQAKANQAKLAAMASTAEQLQEIDALAKRLEKEREEKEREERERRRADARKSKEEERGEKKAALEKKLAGGEAEEAPKESIYDKKFYELAKYIDVEKKDMGKKGVKLDTVLKDPRFHEIYEQKRDERLRALLKGAVPVPNTQLSQVLNAGTGTQRMGVSDYHPLIQRELLGAYLDAIRTYKQTTAMA